MKLKFLKIENWKQFDAINIEFHDRLTVLTGANASGKTTLLNILGQHFGWNFQELSTPVIDSKTGKIKFSVPVRHPSPHKNTPMIGRVGYDEDTESVIMIDDREPRVAYSLIFPGEEIKGLYIPSDRPEFMYKPIEQIPAKGKSRTEAFGLVSTAHQERVLEPVPHERHFPCYYIKETLIGWGIYGFGSEVIDADQEFKDMYRGFESILRKILPEELGFKRFSIRKAEVVLVTKSGEFMIEAVSGGIGAFIDLAWQIYTFSGRASDPFVVLIDEVETHLHAAMQRKLLPTFLHIFPNAQFIVSTHSPLIIGSVRDSSVYVLKHNDKHRVESIRLDIINKAKDAVDILRDVLGVSFTMPVWVEKKLNEINEKYSKLEIDEDTLTSLRKELTEIGLEDLVPYSIDTILSSK